jgi:hypothetical protein
VFDLRNVDASVIGEKQLKHPEGEKPKRGDREKRPSEGLRLKHTKRTS